MKLFHTVTVGCIAFTSLVLPHITHANQYQDMYQNTLYPRIVQVAEDRNMDIQELEKLIADSIGRIIQERGESLSSQSRNMLVGIQQAAYDSANTSMTQHENTDNTSTAVSSPTYDTPGCTETELRGLITQAQAGDTITLNCSQPIVLSDYIMIDKDLTIDGQGSTVIDGNQQTRLFVLAKQLGRLIDGRKNPTPAQGGEGLHLTLRGLTLQKAVGSPLRYGTRTDNIRITTDGSALYVGIRGHATLDKVILRNNTSPTDGGAIYIHGGDSGTLNIKESTFEENTAQGGWGAIASQQATVDIEYSWFHNNTSVCSTLACLQGERGAGAVRVRAGALKVTHTAFHHNQGNLGGAINLLQSSFGINQSEFVGNKTTPGRIVEHNTNTAIDHPTMNRTRGGGAIYADTSDRGDAYIRGSHFENNSWPYDGGALYLYLRDEKVDIVDSHFALNNVEGNRAGAIAIYGDASLTNVSFHENFTQEPARTPAQSSVFFQGGTLETYNTQMPDNQYDR